MIHEGMEPIPDALARLGLEKTVTVLAVRSGYPAPKYVQPVLVRRDGRTCLFETSAGNDESVRETEAALAAVGVSRLDAILCTHTHGDHAGAAEFLSRLGREQGGRAPVYLHSSGHRLITSPALAFLDESFDIMVVRSHRSTTRFDELYGEDLLPKQLRTPWLDRYRRIPRSALRFVDRGALPAGILALHVPGHASDCVVYLDEATGVAVPGDTILTGGVPGDTSSYRFVVPPLTVIDSKYSRAVEAYLVSLGRLRRFFETHDVRVIVPPHGRLAVVEPLAWWRGVVEYFEAIYEGFVTKVLDDPGLASDFAIVDVGARIEHPRAEPMSTSSHLYGLACLLVEEGVLDAVEDPRTRRIRFRRVGDPAPDFVRSIVEEDRSPLAVLRGTDLS
ncbi:MAG: MBL fold metallo-hydrolase [Polyangiales bacterium]